MWHARTQSPWGGGARAHVCIQGTGAPDPAGGGGGQWGQTATPADPAVEQVGPWGIGKGLHRLAEAQPSALPAVAPAPGLGDKLHPHLGLVQRTQEERGAVSPPSSTGSQGPASQPGVEGLAESQAPGLRGTGGSGQRASRVHPSRPRGSWPLRAEHARGVERWPAEIRGLRPGAQEALPLPEVAWDSEPPRCALGSPLLVHDTQTALTLAHPSRPPCGAGPSASRTRDPDPPGVGGAWGQGSEPGWTSPGGLTGRLQRARGRGARAETRAQGSALVPSALPRSTLVQHV